MTFPTIEMTLSEYNRLPDYSTAIPVDLKLRTMWRAPEMCYPGERLVFILTSEDIVQVYSCNIIEAKPAQGISGREMIDLIWDNFKSVMGDDG